MRVGVLIFLISIICPAANSEWPQFRGPNGSGIADAQGLPVQFGPEENLIWRTELPPGFSSPVVTAKQIFVRAYDGPILWTVCLDRATGREMWRRKSPRILEKEPKGPNSPVSPSPASDGENVYSFFEAFGLVSYTPDGAERWKLELGPFNVPYGLGASPVISGSTLLLLCDQDTGSFLLALDKDTGQERWRVERPQATHGFASPVIYEPEGGSRQVIVSGSFQLTGYALDTGERIWWVNGMAWQAKSMPVVGDGVIYVHSWMASPAELGFPSRVPPFEEMLAENDADKDGKLSKDETPDKELVKYWFLFDLDKDGYLTAFDWDGFRSRTDAKNGLYAIRPRGTGDITAEAVLWRHEKSLPNIPSPLLYNGVLYVLKEGGILTALDPKDGSVLKQGRVEGAVDGYFASPVAADGKIITLSKEGKAAVLKAGGEWKVLQVNDLGEECWATPAIAGDRIFLRTQEALYSFGISD